MLCLASAWLNFIVTYDERVPTGDARADARRARGRVGPPARAPRNRAGRGVASPRSLQLHETNYHVSRFKSLISSHRRPRI